MGLDDHRLANWQLAVVFGAQEDLQSFLQVPPEKFRVGEIDATIHEAEAVGGADDGIGFDAEDVAGRDLHFLDAVEVLRPRRREPLVAIPQPNPQAIHRPSIVPEANPRRARAVAARAPAPRRAPPALPGSGRSRRRAARPTA